MDTKSGSVKTGFFRTLRNFLDKSRLGDLLVSKGLISPGQLRQALQAQKTAALPLGQILLQNQMISRGQLRHVLVRQSVLRCATAFIFCVAALTQLPGRKARADGIRDLSIQMAFTNASAPNYSQLSGFPALFDSNEKRSGNIKPFTKWSDMFAKFDRQVANGQATHVAAQWRETLAGVQGGSLKSMAAEVNSLMNSKPYISDSRNWGASDYWATPVEFMQKGGDCEDYAIAKYAALRTLGVPDERMRVAIVQDTLKNIPHAVLIVYAEDGPYILDNQVKTLVDASHAGRYRPIFSINRSAWWLHTAPAATQVASAR